jgi:anaerobic ribonucleoside-triphosphate reductase activating protein
VVWVQGCTLGCPGCFNPETHSFAGDRTSTDDLFTQIVGGADHIEGVTVSGGEPLQQRRGVAALLARIRAETDLSVVVFTGYSWDEAQRFGDVLASVDVLLAGRLGQKTTHFLTDRYTPADLAAVPPAEVVIEPDGTVVFTGLDPLPVRRPLLTLDLDVEGAHLDDGGLAHLDVEPAAQPQ